MSTIEIVNHNTNKSKKYVWKSTIEKHTENAKTYSDMSDTAKYIIDCIRHDATKVYLIPSELACNITSKLCDSLYNSYTIKIERYNKMFIAYDKTHVSASELSGVFRLVQKECRKNVKPVKINVLESMARIKQLNKVMEHLAKTKFDCEEQMVKVKEQIDEIKLGVNRHMDAL
jgi:hypothetical protein